MRVLLTGATGYIGSAVLDALLAAGHEVTGLVRGQEKADAVALQGAIPVVGDLADPNRTRELARAADGVVHLASPGDATSHEIDEITTTAVLDALAGTGKPFVYTAGVWDHGSGSDITEFTPFNPPRLTAWRPPISDRVRRATGSRPVVIAPGVAYGREENLLNLVTDGPRGEGGAAALTSVGTGEQHWGPVHVDDLGDLYVRCLENAPPGSYFLGVDGSTPTVREITRAVSNRLGLDGRVTEESLIETQQRLGLLGEALLLDQRVTGTAARRVLGWAPSRPTLLEHLTEYRPDADRPAP
jgi:nucleoside-diphosphate-sugar epimerase